jgi:Tfp pilus assembly protein PilN
MASPNELSFLPDGYTEGKAQRRMNALCAILFLLVMAGVGSAFFLSEQATKKVDSEFARIDDQYLSEAKRLDQVKQMQEKQRRMAQQAELTASLLERIPRSFILAEVTNSLPAGTALLDINLESKSRAKAASKDGPKTAYEQKKAAREAQKSTESQSPALPEVKTYDVTLTLTGVATNDVQVAQFMNKLSHSELFKDVNLVISETFKQDEQMLRKFQIEMTVRPDAQVDLTAAAGKTPQRTTAVEMQP